MTKNTGELSRLAGRDGDGDGDGDGGGEIEARQVCSVDKCITILS